MNTSRRQMLLVIGIVVAFAGLTTFVHFSPGGQLASVVTLVTNLRSLL